MFQLRNFNSITLGMVDHAQATQSDLTDWEIGSPNRTILEASAIELDEFYQRVLAGILEAIPTAVYRAFDFTIYTAAAARGQVNIAFSQALTVAVTVPAGSIFVNPTTNLRYVSEESVTANIGATSMAVMAYCAVTGSQGNTAANTITSVAGFSLPNTATIGNVAISSGIDGETDEQRRARFNAFIQTLVRGTPAAVAYAARYGVRYDSGGNAIEYVSRLGYEEVQGWAGVYLWCGGGAPSSMMIAAAQRAIDGDLSSNTPGYRPCGVKIEVMPMTSTEVVVNLWVWRLSGFSQSDVQNGIATAIENLFSSTPNNTLLYVASMVDAALTVPGVLRCITTNTENIIIGASNIPQLSALNIIWKS